MTTERTNERIVKGIREKGWKEMEKYMKGRRKEREWR
jgi:hypothetical protein